MSGKRLKDPIRPSKRGVIFDPVNPQLFRQIDLMYCCEQCSHFDAPNKFCTIGYDASKHLRAVQLQTYNLCGRMAVCRFQEID